MDISSIEFQSDVDFRKFLTRLGISLGAILLWIAAANTHISLPNAYDSNTRVNEQIRIPLSQLNFDLYRSKIIYLRPVPGMPLGIWQAEKEAGILETNGVAYWWGVLGEHAFDYFKLEKCRRNWCGFSSQRAFNFAIGLATQTALMDRLAYGYFQQGPVTPTRNCPYTGDLANDGCQASPGGTVQHANFYTGYTGTTYATRPNYNVNGIDFPTGMPAISNSSRGICGKDFERDPATASSGAGGVGNPGCGVIPSGGSYSATGVRGQDGPTPTIWCHGVSADNLTLEGFNLNAVGGHAGTVLYLHNTVASPHVVIAYNDGSNPDAAGIYAEGYFFNVVSNSHFNLKLYANTLDGQWPTNFSTKAAFTGGTGGAPSTTLTVTALSSGKILPRQSVPGGRGFHAFGIDSQLTGSGGHPCPDPSCDGGVGTYQMTGMSNIANDTSLKSLYQLAGGFASTTGGLTVQYTVLNHFNNRPISGVIGQVIGPGTTIGDIVFQWFYVEGMLYDNSASGQHGEMFEGSFAGNSQTTIIDKEIYRNGVCYQPSDVANSETTACIYMSAGDAGSRQGADATYTINQAIVSENTLVIPTRNTSAAVVWNDFFVKSAEISGNYTDRTGTIYDQLCQHGPKIGGANQATELFVTRPKIKGNINLVNGENTDSILLTLGPNCRSA